jgi:hypothetical protein
MHNSQLHDVVNEASKNIELQHYEKMQVTSSRNLELTCHFDIKFTSKLGISIVGVPKKVVSTTKSAYVSVSNESIF